MTDDDAAAVAATAHVEEVAAAAPEEPDLSALMAGMGDLIGNLKKKQVELARRVSPMSGQARRASPGKKKKKKNKSSNKNSSSNTNNDKRRSPTPSPMHNNNSNNNNAYVASNAAGAGAGTGVGTGTGTGANHVAGAPGPTTGVAGGDVNADGDATAAAGPTAIAGDMNHEDDDDDEEEEEEEEEDDPLNDPALLRARAICAAMGTLTPSLVPSPNSGSTVAGGSTRAPESLISKGLRKSKHQRAAANGVSQVKVRSKRAGKGGLSPTGDARGLSSVDQDEESERLIALAKSLCAPPPAPASPKKRVPISTRVRVAKNKKPKQRAAPTGLSPARRKEIEAAAATKTLRELAVDTAGAAPSTQSLDTDVDTAVKENGQHAGDALQDESSSPSAHGGDSPTVGGTSSTDSSTRSKNISQQYLEERKRREREETAVDSEAIRAQEEKAAARAREQEAYRAKLAAKIARERREKEELVRQRKIEEEEEARARAEAAVKQRERALKNAEAAKRRVAEAARRRRQRELQEEDAVMREEEERKRRYVEKQRKLGGAAAARQRVVKARQQQERRHHRGGARSRAAQGTGHRSRQQTPRQASGTSSIHSNEAEDDDEGENSITGTRKGANLDQQTILAMERQRRLETQKRMATKQARLKRERDRAQRERERKLELHRLRTFGIAVKDTNAQQASDDDASSPAERREQQQQQQPTNKPGRSRCDSTGTSSPSSISTRSTKPPHRAHDAASIGGSARGLLPASPQQPRTASRRSTHSNAHCEVLTSPSSSGLAPGVSVEVSPVNTSSRPQLRPAATGIASGGIFTADQFRGKLARLTAYTSPTFRARQDSNNISSGDDDLDDGVESDSSGGLSDLNAEDLQQWRKGSQRNAKTGATHRNAGLPAHGSDRGRHGRQSHVNQFRGKVKSASGYQSHHGRPSHNVMAQNQHRRPGSSAGSTTSRSSRESSSLTGSTKRKGGFRAPPPISLKPIEAYIKGGGTLSGSDRYKSRGASKREHNADTQASRARNNNDVAPSTRGSHGSHSFGGGLYDRGTAVAAETHNRAQQVLQMERQQQRQQTLRQHGVVGSHGRSSSHDDHERRHLASHNAALRSALAGNVRGGVGARPSQPAAQRSPHPQPARGLRSLKLVSGAAPPTLKFSARVKATVL